MEMHPSAVKEETGFSSVEMLLCLIIVIMITFVGFYVYNTQKSATDSYNAASKAAQATAPKSSNAKTVHTAAQKTLAIKEFGVKVAYSGDDSYTYRDVSSRGVEIISKNLNDTYGCSDIGGGMIARGKASDTAMGPQTIGELAAQNPAQYKLIDGYYYYFLHDQAACSNSVTPEAENEVNAAVAKLIPVLQAE